MNKDPTSWTRFRYNEAMSTVRKGVVRIGPAGWSYHDWKGIVYPTERPRGFDDLSLVRRESLRDGRVNTPGEEQQGKGPRQ